jgi:hypothetical protein
MNSKLPRLIAASTCERLGIAKHHKFVALAAWGNPIERTPIENCTLFGSGETAEEAIEQAARTYHERGFSGPAFSVSEAHEFRVVEAYHEDPELVNPPKPTANEIRVTDNVPSMVSHLEKLVIEFLYHGENLRLMRGDVPTLEIHAWSRNVEAWHKGELDEARKLEVLADIPAILLILSQDFARGRFEHDAQR